MICPTCGTPCEDVTKTVGDRTVRRTQCVDASCSDPLVLPWIDVTDADENGVLS